MTPTRVLVPAQLDQAQAIVNGDGAGEAVGLLVRAGEPLLGGEVGVRHHRILDAPRNRPNGTEITWPGCRR